MRRLTKPLDEADVKTTKMTHTPIREIHLADDRMFNDSLDAYRDIVNKLGGNEDIEDGLGIDFGTLKSACENGFYSSYFGEIVKPLRLIIFDGDTRPYFEVYDRSFDSIKFINVDEFGKTWALEKRELEER